MTILIPNRCKSCKLEFTSGKRAKPVKPIVMNVSRRESDSDGGSPNENAHEKLPFDQISAFSLFEATEEVKKVGETQAESRS